MVKDTDKINYKHKIIDYEPQIQEFKDYTTSKTIHINLLS